MLHAGDHANGRRTEELVRRAANGREGSASLLLHFTTSIFSTVAKGSWIDHFFHKVSNFLWHTSCWFL